MSTNDLGSEPRAVPKSYKVVTYGCQMNVHDSERISGLLEDAGYVRADEAATPDVVVFNTCAVRENADNRLYGNLGHLRPSKLANPGMQIAVRSEEHTSELQSQSNLVCRLLLEKKNRRISPLC